MPGSLLIANHAHPCLADVSKACLCCVEKKLSSRSYSPHTHAREMGTTEEKARQQVEFYLSSSNLMKDKFLRPIVLAEPEGYVDVALIAGFPRVQQITRDRDLLVRALRQSTELEVDAAGDRVRRREPFVEYDTEANTVYAVPTTQNLRLNLGPNFLEIYLN